MKSTAIDAVREIIIGRTVDAASAQLQHIGWSLRVMRQDGSDFVGTCDYDPSRVNVAVVDGKITAVTSVG